MSKISVEDFTTPEGRPAVLALVEKVMTALVGVDPPEACLTLLMTVSVLSQRFDFPVEDAIGILRDLDAARRLAESTDA